MTPSPYESPAAPEPHVPEPGEAALRAALHRAAGQVQPSPWRPEPTRERARRQARRRARATLLAAVAATAVAVCVPMTVTGVPHTGTHTVPGGGAAATATVPPARSPAASAPPASPSAAAPPAPSPQVVPAGHELDLGHGLGLGLELTADQVCLINDVHPGGETCDSVHLPVGDGPIHGRLNGDSSGVLVEVLYVGPGTAARITVRARGTDHPATVLTLSGRPGYAVGHVWIPAAQGGSTSASLRVTVADASGHQLAASTY